MGKIRATLATSVVECHLANPEWTYKQVAEAVGATDIYVRKIAQRRGLEFSSKRKYTESSEAPKKPRRKKVSKSKPKRFVPTYYGRASAGHTSFSYVQLM